MQDQNTLQRWESSGVEGQTGIYHPSVMQQNYGSEHVCTIAFSGMPE